MKTDSKRIVKIACVAGVFVVLFFALVIIWTALRTNTGILSKNQYDGVSFVEKLRRFDEIYDTYLRSGRLPAREISEALFAALEKTAIGAEGRLSVLKRLRLLSRADASFLPDYAASALRAAEKFPHSVPLAAIAGETLVLFPEAAQSDSPSALQKNYARVLAGSGPLGEQIAQPAAFYLYALAGSLSTPESAAALPEAGSVFRASMRDLVGEDAVSMAINGAILSICAKNMSDAAVYLIPLDRDGLLSSRSRMFFACYEYDFGDLITAAKLWTDAGGEKNLALAAGAFYEAGMTESALQLWYLIAQNTVKDPEAVRLRCRSLYNTARHSGSRLAKTNALETLLSVPGGAENGADAVLYGTLLYTRLMGGGRAEAILTDLTENSNHPLFDLELHRQRVRRTPIEKAVADTWLLVDRHWNDNRVYRWAAWFFGFLRRSQDLDSLVDAGVKRGRSGIWMDLARARNAIRAEDYDAAERFLDRAAKEADSGYEEDLPSEQDWPADADRALIFEARHDFRSALSFYASARNKIPLRDVEDDDDLKKSAAKIELRLSRCYSALGMREEARRAVLNASELDGEDIGIRMAKDRL